jgi:hypothetical protein
MPLQLALSCIRIPKGEPFWRRIAMGIAKTYVLSALLLLVAGTMQAQEEETLLSGGLESGGYGAPVVKFTNFKGEFAVIVGGYGGWLINHSFLLGGGGYGLATHHKLSTSSGSAIFPEDGRIIFGYGGGILEYIFSPRAVVHATICLLIGGGSVSVQEQWTDPATWVHGYQTDEFFVLEPSVNVELNVTTFFRVDAGASYRFVNGVSAFDLKNADLSGASINIALKFGSF